MAVLQGSFLSSEIGRLSHFTVILPHDTVTNPPASGYPVLYILPGRTDDCNTWLYRTNIERYAYFKGIAVVIPSGDGSFYANMANGSRYFTMVTKELPEVVRNMFRVGFSRLSTLPAANATNCIHLPFSSGICSTTTKLILFLNRLTRDTNGASGTSQFSAVLTQLLNSGLLCRQVGLFSTTILYLLTVLNKQEMNINNADCKQSGSGKAIQGLYRLR